MMHRPHRILASIGLLALLALVALPLLTAPVAQAQAPAWDGNGRAYAVGDVVSYQGVEYRCRQAHTSQPDWNPVAVPALWERVSAGGPTATSAPPTATSAPPTATSATSPATATPTTASGTCSAPAWSRSAVYTGGNEVSHNGRKWRAKWWTQGEEPGTTGPNGVWEDRGACAGATATPATPTATAAPATPTSTATTPTATSTPGGGGDRIIGYFAAWGVYGRNYHVKNIVTSGAAAKLTHINYAFGNVVNNRCAIGDAYADYDRAYTAALSVDGVADTWDQPLRGSFNQLRKLKQLYPNIKTLISLGGWTWSAGFSDAALPQNREAFVRSCVELFITNPQFAGVFDGIDIDWEYPGACGNTCAFRPEDKQNFTALLAEFRRQLDAARPGALLTIAAPAGPDKIAQIEVERIHPYLDFINLMTYDIHGAWENQTNFQSHLYTPAGDPATGNARVSVDDAVSTWLTRGTPAGKLVIGVPFYGRGWTGVPATNNGLWQTATGGAPGTYEAGIEDYKVLKTKGLTRYYNSAARAAWLYGGGIFWTYDDPPILAEKMVYINQRGLGGVMFWELSGDTADGELITALYNNR